MLACLHAQELAKDAVKLAEAINKRLDTASTTGELPSRTPHLSESAAEAGLPQAHASCHAEVERPRATGASPCLPPRHGPMAYGSRNVPSMARGRCMQACWT